MWISRGQIAFFVGGLYYFTQCGQTLLNAASGPA